MKNYDDIKYFDSFIGGVPPDGLFEMQRASIIKLIENSSSTEKYLAEQLYELSLIGLVAYFEGFCKNHFAFTLNLFPNFAEKLIQNRIEFDIKIRDLNLLNYNIKNRLGSLLAEKIDFGKAKQINLFYKNLFEFTAFSNNDLKKFHQLLSDRNLLVHHSGIFTLNYQESTKNKNERVYLDSIRVDYDFYKKWDDFLFSMYRKIIKQSYTYLISFIEHDNNLKEEQKTALSYFKRSVNKQYFNTLGTSK